VLDGSSAAFIIRDRCGQNPSRRAVHDACHAENRSWDMKHSSGFLAGVRRFFGAEDGPVWMAPALQGLI
jgi:hypothetical protein